MSNIAIDLTPVAPGGRNGGAQISTLELVGKLASAAPENRYILLTASWNEKLLSGYRARNVTLKRVITEPAPEKSRPAPRPLKTLLGLFQRGCRALATPIARQLRRKRLLSSLGADLLFCPFTAPTYSEKGIPVVCVVHDLQHLVYPQFFDSREKAYRKYVYEGVSRSADKVICHSEYVRGTVHGYLNISPDRTTVIPISIHNRFPHVSPETVDSHLKELGIRDKKYILYPANFWPHKNHRMLITAYSMFLHENPGAGIDMVFTGSPHYLHDELKKAVHDMGLGPRIHFTGYLSEEKLAAVWQRCDLMAFPSLYEGFGIPLLEAMAFNKPIICSNATSIPEICGNAGLYFDPRKPNEIVLCLKRILDDSNIRNSLLINAKNIINQTMNYDIINRYIVMFDKITNRPNTEIIA